MARMIVRNALGDDLVGIVRDQNGEFVASQSRAAGSLRYPAPDNIGDPLEDFVADNVPIKVVDLFEEVEVEEQQLAPALAQVRVAEHAHQLAPVSEAGDMVDKSIVMSGLLRELIGGKRLLQVLRPPPCEQDHRDVEQQGDGEMAVDTGSGRSANRSRDDALPHRHEQE